MTIRNSRGIITLLNFSIPSLMPTTTIRAERKRKAVCAKSGVHVDVTREVNILWESADPVKEKVADVMR